jgi:putative tryptophan/tyrosine transport system substrate-binding protein
VDRREFLSAVTVSLLAAPGAAEAQPAARAPRVAALGLTPIPPSLAEAFKQGLGEFGYTDGQNIAIEYRDADGKPERLSQLAADLVQHKVDVILAREGGALSAAKQATGRIPTAAVDLESDPVAMGFVRSLAQPGGNITGVFLDLPELSGKQLHLLKEIIRPFSRVAILGDPVLNAPQFEATEVTARALAIQPQRLDVRAAKDLDAALEAASRGRANALLLLPSPLMVHHRTELAALAARRRLPTVSVFIEFAEAGSLMAYGPSLREAFRRAGGFASRILQGAKPAEMPVERPTKFELVINLKTAKALGLTIPSSLISRADRVIE